MQLADDIDFKLIRFLIYDHGNVRGQLQRHGWPLNGSKHVRPVLLGCTYEQEHKVMWGTRPISWALIQIDAGEDIEESPAIHTRSLGRDLRGTIEFGYMYGHKYRQKFRKSMSRALSAMWTVGVYTSTRKVIDDLNSTFASLRSDFPDGDWQTLLEDLRHYGWHVGIR